MTSRQGGHMIGRRGRQRRRFLGGGPVSSSVLVTITARGGAVPSTAARRCGQLGGTD